MSPLEVIGSVVAIVFVAVLAWCEDVRAREANKPEPDGSVGGIDRTRTPYWRSAQPFQVGDEFVGPDGARNRIDSAVPGRDEYGGSSPQVSNSGHQVIGSGKEPATSARASQEAGSHE